MIDISDYKYWEYIYIERTNGNWTNSLNEIRFTISLGCYLWNTLGDNEGLVWASGDRLRIKGGWRDDESEIIYRKVELIRWKSKDISWY